MMNSSRLLILVICVFWSLNGMSQNKLTFGLAYGFNHQVIKESRFTSNFRSGLGMVTDIQVGSYNATAWKNLKISFIYNRIGKRLTSPMISLVPEVRFEYIRQKKIKSLQLGAYADVGSFLGFRAGRWDSVNGISYAIWSGLGLSAHYDKQIAAIGKNATFKFSIAHPLVSYLIRPASVRFPYPDDFLKQENFNFDLDGLGRSILSSGKIKTINSFINLNLEVGLEFQLNDGPWHLETLYCLDYLYVREQLPLLQFNNQIKFLISKF